MRRIYLVIPGLQLTHQLHQELLSNGIDETHMQLFSRSPRQAGEHDLPLKRVYPQGRHFILFGLTGAVVALTLTLLVIPFLGMVIASGVLLVIALIGLLAGLAIVPWAGYPRDLKRIRQELSADDVLLLLDVRDQELGELEQEIKSRHPEIRVKGTDPGGSPPFP